jgi:nitrite reductase (NO-forming)
MPAIGISWRSVAFTVAAAMLLVLGAACTDDPLSVSEPTLVPPPGVPAGHELGNQRVVVHLESVEASTEIAPGVTYTTWTFNGSVPGAMLRARVGDTLEIHLKNPASNTASHNIDLHAATGPGGGAGVSTVAPGEEKAFEFKATTPGLFVYHCAAGIVADHIANGMYGGILIEPASGLPKVDHEFYVGQSEFYTTGNTGDAGAQSLDFDKLMAEDPTYVVFNGNTKSLIGDKALHAKVGETVRIYVANGGPNYISSFHVIGEIFDKAWASGTLKSEPDLGVQTVLVAPGGAAIVEFKVDVPGDYKLVDHAISRVSKGAVGTLHVDGPENPSLFKSLSGVTGAAAGGHDMGTTAPATTATATAAATTAVPTASPTAAATTAPANGATGAVAFSMKDNTFPVSKLTAKVGEKLTLNITNEGAVPHNVRIAGADGKYDAKDSVVSSPEIITAKKTGTLTWTPPKAGTYKFQCDLHPDQMTGTITVQ